MWLTIRIRNYHPHPQAMPPCNICIVQVLRNNSEIYAENSTGPEMQNKKLKFYYELYLFVLCTLQIGTDSNPKKTWRKSN